MQDKEKEKENPPESPEPEAAPETRAIGIFQDITEQKAEEIIYALKIYESESGEPIDFFISSNGGSAADMFAIYDFMRNSREEVVINTFGLGKVMSAAVLLLAAGTKGERKIGKHCRVMIHSVIGGTGGPLQDLKNEMEEIQQMQDMYISAMCEETNLTKKKLKDLFSKNVNVYISAEDAVKYGIADIIV